MKIKISIYHKKIRNQLAVQTTIFAEREDGTTHSKKFITHGDIEKAKREANGKTALFLRNITQRVSLVEMV